MPPWLQVIYRLVGPAYAITQHAVDYLFETDDEQELIWHRCMIKCTDDVSSVAADDTWITFDVVNWTGVGLDPTWTDADFQTCETHFLAYMTTWITYMQNRYRWDRFQWYKRQFAPYPATEPPDMSEIPDFEDSGPPVRVAGTGLAGQAAAPQAAQVALSVTERTATRKNWGRHYLPGVASTALDLNGHVKAAVVTAMAEAFEDCVANLAAAGFQLVVPLTRIDGVRHHQLQSVDQISIDDVPDVIRRRRPKYPLFKVVLPAP